MSQYEELKTLNEQYNISITEKDNTIAAYEAEEKERLIAKFTGKIPSDVMQQIEEAKDTMSISEMNNRFALEYTSFSMAKEQNEEIRVPQLPQEETSALARILSKYKK